MSTGRCLDCGVCSECHACVDACPANAINLDMKGQEEVATVGAVIVSTGFNLFPADLKPEYGYGRFKNVITGMQMDRLLAPTRPYNTVLRPGDGKAPDRIAYIMCTGSRDQTVGNPLCSKRYAACTRSSRTSSLWVPSRSPTSPSTTSTCARSARDTTSSTGRPARWERNSSRDAWAASRKRTTAI